MTGHCCFSTRLLQYLYSAGERPSYDEFKTYLEVCGPLAGGPQAGQGIWSTILRDPYHQFRVKGTLSLEGLMT